jgi:hypothetical protein
MPAKSSSKLLVDIGLEKPCGSLVNFLNIALVQPSLTRKEPWRMQAHTGKACYVPGPNATSYRREHVLYRDLPGLRPGTIFSAASNPTQVDLSRGMRDMVAEARAERHDHLHHREEAQRSRTVREELGDAITDRLLLL